MSEIQLPEPGTEFDPVYVDPRSALFYSAPKQGKTSLAKGLAAHGPYLSVMLEDGGGYEKLARYPEKGALQNYVEYRELFQKIRAAGRPYRYIVLDTITALDINPKFANALALYEYTNSDIGKNFTGDNILKVKRGGGYYWYRKAFKDMLDWAWFSVPEGGALILLAHLRDKMLGDEKTGVSISDINLTGQLREIVSSGVDAIGLLTRQTKKGEILLNATFSSGESDVAGTRIRRLAGQTITVSKEDAEGNLTFDWSQIFTQ